MPQRPIPRDGSECDGLADARVTRTAGLPYSVFRIPYVGLGAWLPYNTHRSTSFALPKER
jgi:hypothetical protein